MRVSIIAYTKNKIKFRYIIKMKHAKYIVIRGTANLKFKYRTKLEPKLNRTLMIKIELEPELNFYFNVKP